MAIITKELALKIAKKLRVQINARPGKPHDVAPVYEQGRLLATFGIPRGSSKDLGHDHIPRQLHVSARQARLLGQCPPSRDDWIGILAEKGLA